MPRKYSYTNSFIIIINANYPQLRNEEIKKSKLEGIMQLGAVHIMLANSLMHYLHSTLQAKYEKKEGKSTDRSHHLHPIGTTRQFGGWLQQSSGAQRHLHLAHRLFSLEIMSINSYMIYKIMGHKPSHFFYSFFFFSVSRTLHHHSLALKESDGINSNINLSSNV